MSILSTISNIVNHPLNDDQKVDALFRFLKWQIGSRLVPGDIVFEWVNGAKLIVRSGETGLTLNLYCGLEDFYEMAYLLHVFREKDMFIDIGANSGAYTILACASIGAKAYSFEPVPSAYSRLINNIILNKLDDRVKCLNIGVGDQDGFIQFTLDRNTMNHVIVNNENVKEKKSIEIRRLDTILHDESPSLIKIDVEGYEVPVLSGASCTLEKESLHSVIIELNGSGNRYGYNDADILRIMKAKGFSSYHYEPENRKLVDLHGEKKQNSKNTLFIRDLDTVKNRIQSAPTFTIHGRSF